MQLPWAVQECFRLHARVTNTTRVCMRGLPLLNLINYRHHRNGEPGDESVIAIKPLTIIIGMGIKARCPWDFRSIGSGTTRPTIPIRK